MSPINRRSLMMDMEDNEVKDWTLIKDYTVPEGEIVKTVTTPSEEEMIGFTELFVEFESYTVGSDGSDVTTSDSARPAMIDYTGTESGYGRLTGDVANTIGTSSSGRILILYVMLIADRIFGYCDNMSYSINSFMSVSSIASLQSLPCLKMGNKSGLYYKEGTRIKVYAR